MSKESIAADALGQMAGKIGKRIFSMEPNKFLEKYYPMLNVRDAAYGQVKYKDLPLWGQVKKLPKYSDEVANNKMRESMKANGFTDPLTVNKRGEIVGGVRAALIAHELGIPIRFIKANY